MEQARKIEMISWKNLKTNIDRNHKERKMKRVTLEATGRHTEDEMKTDCTSETSGGTLFSLRSCILTFFFSPTVFQLHQ